MRKLVMRPRDEFAQVRGEDQQDHGSARHFALPGSGVTLPPRIRGGHAYADLRQGTLLLPTINTSYTMLLRSAQLRNYLSIRNVAPAGTEVIYVGFDTPANTASWLRLTSNQIVTFDVVVPQNDIFILCDTANGQVSYAYSTLPDYLAPSVPS